MPIIGMTRREDVQNAVHRLVIGELHKGGPKVERIAANGNRYLTYGPDLDHWRFTSDRSSVLAAWNTAILAPWNAAHQNDKVTEVEAYLPFAKLEQNWVTWYEEYDYGGMIHRCDGATMTRWRKSNGTYEDGAKPCPYHAGTKERTKATPGCTQVGRLYLVLPALVRTGLTGLVTMHTRSINDLVTITAQLLDAEEKAGGDLRGILFTVYRYKDEISTPTWNEDKKDGKRRVVKYLVGIAPAHDWVMARLQLEARKALAAVQRLQWAAGDADNENTSEGEYTVVDAQRADAESIARAAAEAADAVDGDDEGNEDEDGIKREPNMPEGQVGEADLTLLDETQQQAMAIKARILKLAREGAAWKAEICNEKKRDAVNRGFAILIPLDDRRHAIRQYLLGHDSSTYTEGEVAALLGWFDIKNGPDGAIPGVQALAEVKVLAAALGLDKVDEVAA